MVHRAPVATGDYMDMSKFDSLFVRIDELDNEERDEAEVKVAAIATGDNTSQKLPAVLDKPFHKDATVRDSSMIAEGQ